MTKIIYDILYVFRSISYTMELLNSFIAKIDYDESLKYESTNIKRIYMFSTYNFMFAILELILFLAGFYFTTFFIHTLDWSLLCLIKLYVYKFEYLKLHNGFINYNLFVKIGALISLFFYILFSCIYLVTLQSCNLSGSYKLLIIMYICVVVPYNILNTYCSYILCIYICWRSWIYDNMINKFIDYKKISPVGIIETDTKCIICTDIILSTDYVLKLDCNHLNYHDTCIIKWLYTKRTCPECRLIAIV